MDDDVTEAVRDFLIKQGVEVTESRPNRAQRRAAKRRSK